MVTDLFQWSVIDYLFNTDKRLYWAYLMCSAAIALVYIRFTRSSIKSLFSKSIWWHTSAKADYMYFILTAVIKALIVVPLLFGVSDVAMWTLQWLNQNLGYQEKIYIQRSTVVLIYSFSLFVVSDFTRYWLHRFMHNIPLLWEFHKVHHSAEVLTPVTFYRIHPVENVLFGLRYVLSAGVVTGGFIYYFGAMLGTVEILGVNAFVFLAHIAGDNLRHSHIHLRYPNFLERLLISPAQHQYHHTLEGSRTNFGGVLAIWDVLFGTLVVSKSKYYYRFGLGDFNQNHNPVSLLISPFKSSLVLLYRFVKNKTQNFQPTNTLSNYEKL